MTLTDEVGGAEEEEATLEAGSAWGTAARESSGVLSGQFRDEYEIEKEGNNMQVDMRDRERARECGRRMCKRRHKKNTWDRKFSSNTRHVDAQPVHIGGD